MIRFPFTYIKHMPVAYVVLFDTDHVESFETEIRRIMVGVQLFLVPVEVRFKESIDKSTVGF